MCKYRNLHACLPYQLSASCMIYNVHLLLIDKSWVKIKTVSNDLARLDGKTNPFYIFHIYGYINYLINSRPTITEHLTWFLHLICNLPLVMPTITIRKSDVYIGNRVARYWCIFWQFFSRINFIITLLRKHSSNHFLP